MVAIDTRIVEVIDSHTGGEPTRVVVSGGPDLGSGPIFERRERFRAEHDNFRSAVVNEPRGSDVIVGALLCEPFDKASMTGVIFFNNVGYIGMCGHGTIGLVVTLAHLGRIGTGTHRIETPVGIVEAALLDSGKVRLANVPSFRHEKDVHVRLESGQLVTGDVAWGGNWFFLVDDPDADLSLANVEQLSDRGWQIRRALARAGVTGADGAEIDHVELFGRSQRSDCDSRNFVLCPGGQYDRSPCGTGTSAKVACLYEDGKLVPGQVWRQEGIVGTVFEATVKALDDGKVIPTIQGSAYVTAESRLLLDPRDPFVGGLTS